MWKYAALLSYIGTDYNGWQKQKETNSGLLTSIQETLEGALSRITSESLSVVGSGRTDSGVHALGQVAHFILKTKEWDPAILLRSLNGVLPPSIRILEVNRVSLEFHAQKSAVKKQYSYYFQQGPCPLPHLLPYSWWIRKRLDIEAMREGLEFLKGEHDFKPFRAAGAKPGSSIRKILEAEITLVPIGFPGVAFEPSWVEARGLGLVRVRLVGTGFLKQMVRGIAGTLLQVGEGRRNPSCFQEILATQDRSAVGPTAPARALWLERVWYPESFDLSLGG